MTKSWNATVWMLRINTSDGITMTKLEKLKAVIVKKFLTVLLVLNGIATGISVNTENPVLIKNTSMRNNRDASGTNSVLTQLMTSTMNVLTSVPNLI